LSFRQKMRKGTRAKRLGTRGIGKELTILKGGETPGKSDAADRVQSDSAKSEAV